MNGLQSFNSSWVGPFGAGWLVGLGGFVFFLLVIWSIIWKGMALWKAAQLRSKIWFVVLLVVNTAGILEILYLYVFSKPRMTERIAKPN